MDSATPAAPLLLLLMPAHTTEQAIRAAVVPNGHFIPREKGYQWDQRVLHAGKCLLYMYKPVIILEEHENAEKNGQERKSEGRSLSPGEKRSLFFDCSFADTHTRLPER